MILKGLPPREPKKISNENKDSGEQGKSEEEQDNTPGVDIEGWDDMDPARRKALKLAHTTLMACEKACIASDQCKQYAFKPGECRLGNAIRLGEEADGETSGMQSRWVRERVEAMRDEAAVECLWWDDERAFHTEN